MTAEVVSSDFAAATDVDYLGVALKTRFDPIRHYVFGGLNYGADIQVSWVSDSVLLIHCEHCEKLNGGNILERKWHGITICYDRSGAANFSEDHDTACKFTVGAPADVPAS